MHLISKSNNSSIFIVKFDFMMQAYRFLVFELVWLFRLWIVIHYFANWNYIQDLSMRFTYQKCVCWFFVLNSWDKFIRIFNYRAIWKFNWRPKGSSHQMYSLVTEFANILQLIDEAGIVPFFLNTKFFMFKLGTRTKFENISFRLF